MIASTAYLFSLSSLYAVLVSANTLDCTHLRTEGVSFNFEKLTGPHSVSEIDNSEEYFTYNRTWTVNICEPLKINDSEPYHCPDGTWVCGIQRYGDKTDTPSLKNGTVDQVIPIAGNYVHGTGKTLEPHIERLKSQGNEKEGLELQMNGGTYENQKQRAVISFECDLDRTGDEVDTAISPMLRARADSDDSDKNNSSLTFVSWQIEEESSDVKVLRLRWRTKYACENFVDEDEGASKGGWGFFTWLILILFVGIAAYLIFGSWLNYNRYGARGWDLLPHGDTIRDIPYLFKDWSRKVIDTVSGGGSRGGYSAV